jgi:hypothetical protein
MKQLYKLTDQISKLQEAFDNGDIPENALADTMEVIEGEFDDKAKAIMAMVRNTDSDITAIADEIKRLNDRAKVLQNQQDSVKEYLRFNMQESGIDKISCSLFTLTLRKSVKIVIIDDVESLPDKYVTVKTVEQPDKKLLLSDLKDGEAIEGAHLEDGKRALMIK